MNMNIFGLVMIFPLMMCCGDAISDKEVVNNKDAVIEQQSHNQCDSQNNVIPFGAQMLINAYPDAQLRYTDNKIIFPDGFSVVYDDKKNKTFIQQLDEADIEDSFAMLYQIGGGTPEYQADGGRSRSDAFFKKMYGASQSEVSKNLTTINWFGTKVRVTTVNGVDEKLQAVATELASHPELKKYLKTAGTWNYRSVRGANRLSAHAYGIAIDICVGYSDYWMWANKKANENTKITYKNRVPEKLVEIFEKHGFVWGGRWYHYDTMHFEYRPEIINAARQNEGKHQTDL